MPSVPSIFQYQSPKSWASLEANFLLPKFRTPDIRLRIFERLVGPNRQLQA